MKLLQPFGCKEILACDLRDFSDFYKEYGVTPVAPDELYAQARIFFRSICRRTRQTRGLYTAAGLDKFKPGILLINTARGGIVDDAALNATAEERHDRLCRGFDVFDVEPDLDPELVTLPNMLATPHLAGLCERIAGSPCRAPASTASPTIGCPSPASIRSIECASQRCPFLREQRGL